MSSSQRDEFTPRELGLLAGHRWAGALATSPEARTQVAEGEITDTLRQFVMTASGMDDRLAAFDDPEAHDAFWSGFVLGARAFIVEDLDRLASPG
jgi:hypothetical protein